VSEVAPLDPERVIRTLARHRVKYVLIGALAARLHGFPRLTADIDIAPLREPENLTRLAAALRDLDARVYTDSVPEGLAFDCSAKALGRSDMWNLITKAGRIDLAFAPSGTDGYDDLAKGAVRFEAFHTNLLAASLEDIIRSKEAANRPQDRQDLPILRAILARQRAADNQS
jgi:hypothetical protein